MPATRPGPSPPPRRHPARPRRRAERPGTRPGPETALTPPTHGATTPNNYDRFRCFSSCHSTYRPTPGGPGPLLGPKVRPWVGLMSAIKAPDPWVAVGARRGRWRGMADLARNAPNRTFSSTVPRPKPATRPGPSPPLRRHPAQPRRQAERPDTRPSPETALMPPTHGATAPNLTDCAVCRRVTTRPARRPGARSRLLPRKCASRCA